MLYKTDPSNAIYRLSYFLRQGMVLGAGKIIAQYILKLYIYAACLNNLISYPI